MKVNLISKYQQGGVYVPPYAVFQSVPYAPQKTGATTDSGSSASGSSSSGSSKDLTDKDLLTMLKDLDGLPSDMAVITSQLQNFYVKALTPGILGKSNSSANIAVRYLGVLNQLKTAKFNKNEYDKAYEKVSSNGGINEVAINDRGQFVCMNEKGDFKLLTAEQLKETEGYVALTNSELLYRRSQDTSLANNNQILSVVKNGISMDTVTKQVQEVIGKLGTTENSQEGYMTTKKGKVIQGLLDFEAAVQAAAGNVNYNGTVNDLYKYKFLTKNQANQAAEAMAYIYNTLAPNAKALLKAKSDLTEDGAKKLLQTLIASSLDNTQQFDVELEGGASAKTTTKGRAASGKDSTDLKSSQLVEMVKSISGVKQQMTIDRGDGIQMTVLGRQFNLVTDTSGKPIENTSLSNMLGQSGIQGIVKNMNSITFGDQKLSAEALKNITYNNTGVMRVNLPTNADGSVNLTVLEAFQKVEAQLEALGRTPTAEEVQGAYASAGLSSLLKADGTPDEHKFGAFLVTEGYTTDALSGIKPSAFVREYKGDTDRAIQTIKQSLTVGTGKDAVVPEIDEDSWWPGDWFGWYDKIYKAAIYIPIDNSTLLAARLDGQNLDYDEALELEEKYQNLGQTSKDVLKNK